MATDINIVEAQNDLETIKKQAEQMRTAFPKTTYMNKGLSKIIGTIDERLNRWDRIAEEDQSVDCLLYTSPSPRDLSTSRMPSSA